MNGQRIAKGPLTPSNYIMQMPQLSSTSIRISSIASIAMHRTFLLS